MSKEKDIIIAKESLWSKALYKFVRDKFGMVAFAIVFIYLLIALGVWLGILGQGWEILATNGRAAISMDHIFGTNINGQDIFKRAIFSTKTAFEVGFVVAVCSAMLGTILGCIAGFFSGTWIDEIVIWFYSCLDSIPFFLFVAAIAFALKGHPYAMHIAMISTFWTATARVIRGEVIKIKKLEYVEAARSIGVSKLKIIFKHIFPNTFHIQLVELTIIFVEAIKSEVILSFLGLGLKEGVSWGLMLSEASQEVIAGEFNNFIVASLFLFVLVMAFNQFSDALQDALDPKKVS